MDTQLKRGVLDICVLSSLQENPSYGYKIIKDVSSCIEISESTLYPILKRLESNDCVVSNKVEHNGRLRKYYSITDAGKNRIDEFLLEWEKLMDVYMFIKGDSDNA